MSHSEVGEDNLFASGFSYGGRPERRDGFYISEFVISLIFPG